MNFVRLDFKTSLVKIW